MNYATPGIGTLTATWEHRGYSGAGNVAGLLDSEQGRAALICGNAAGVFDEWEHAKAIYPDALLFGVNDVGMYLPKLDHWVSLHYQNLPSWKAVRWLHNHNTGIEKTIVHTVESIEEATYIWDQLNPMFALSGYFAMQIAWLMGCQPIVLCGCPGSPTRRFFEAKPLHDFGYGGGTKQSDLNIQAQVRNEMRRVPEFKAVVRSMSGWTQTFFGGIDHG